MMMAKAIRLPHRASRVASKRNEVGSDRLPVLRSADLLIPGHSAAKASTRGAAPDSVPVTVLGRIGRLGLGRALKQAPHRADTEKNADHCTDPEPEHT
jgi:hypothetical protein